MDDAIDEPNETILVVISNPINANINQATGTVTIVDDEGLPTLSIADTNITE